MLIVDIKAYKEIHMVNVQTCSLSWKFQVLFIAFVCVHMQRSEVNVGPSFLPLSTFLIEVGLLTSAGAC